MDLLTKVRASNFKGVKFFDLSPLYADPEAFTFIVDSLCNGEICDGIVCLDARGFLLGAAMSYKLHVPLLLCRKKGKLPDCAEFNLKSVNYELEYGTDSLEMYGNLLAEGSKVLIVDDLLATGGTAKAASCLCKQHGLEVIGYRFIAEISALNGKDSLNHDTYSLIKL